MEPTDTHPKGCIVIEKTTSVHREGQGKKVQGHHSVETGALKLYPCGFESRFEHDHRGTNPEAAIRHP